SIKAEPIQNGRQQQPRGRGQGRAAAADGHSESAPP
ncbi:ATP-dependent RNA helicase RhlE, partial [Pantoea sp. R102]